MYAIDGDTVIVKCLSERLSKDCCFTATCTIKSPVTKLQKEVDELLKERQSLTLSELSKKKI